MLRVADLVTELDVLAQDSAALTTFGNSPAVVQANLLSKRRVVQDWLYGHLQKRGYAPQRHSVRYAPSAAFAYDGASAYTDVQDAASDATQDDLDLTALLGIPDSALYLADAEPMRGLYLSLGPTVTGNVNTLTLAASYWNGGTWSPVTSLVDNTRIAAGRSLSGGGRLDWAAASDWEPRTLATDTAWRYWLRLSVPSSLSAGVTASHILPVRPSRLTRPAVYQTLHYLYAESWGIQRGEWREKADAYQALASDALDAALSNLSEFTIDDMTPAVDPVNTPSPSPDPGLTTWMRG